VFYSILLSLNEYNCNVFVWMCVVDWWIREQWAGAVWQMSRVVVVVCTVTVVVSHLSRTTKFCVWTRPVIFIRTTTVVVAETIGLGRRTKAEVTADESYAGFDCFIPVVYCSSSSWLLSVYIMLWFLVRRDGLLMICFTKEFHSVSRPEVVGSDRTWV